MTSAWDDIYLARGEAKVSWYQDSADETISLLDRAGIGSSASVVDIGAGASRVVDSLLDRGHTDVTVLDVSAAGLDLAKQRLGQKAESVTWIVADLLDWHPGRQFDVWHDRAVFHFLVTAEEIDRYRETLMAAVAPGGFAILATFAEDGPETCSGRPVERYSVERLAGQIGAPFAVVLSDREVHHTPREVVQPFTWLVLQRS